MQRFELGVPNLLQEAFTKMVVGCMNEALNSLRPSAYLFSDTQLRTLNANLQLSRVPPELEGGSEEEMQYQLACAQALSRIFCWNKMEWGHYNSTSEDYTQEDRQKLLEKEDSLAKETLAQERWVFYD